jgi:hypothetical protein
MITPVALRDQVRTAIPIAGVERVAAELEKISDQCAAIGAPDVTLSSLVTVEMTKHLKPPAGWKEAEIAIWRTLPYRLAKYVTEKRQQDMKAVRKCQDLNAEIRRRKELQNARTETPAAA